MRAVTRTPARAPVRTAARPSGGNLRDRRKKARKKGLLILASCLVAAIAICIYVLWLPTFRIKHVEATGPNAEGMATAAQQSVAGTYAHILPRDSIFFFSKDAMRAGVLAAYPQVSALSISRSSFNSIKLSGTSRASSFIWCGTSIDTPIPDGSCYEADAEGLVFRSAAISTTTVVLSTGSSTPATSGDLRIFSALVPERAEGESPVGAKVSRADSIPDALRFVKAIRGLGLPVSSLGLRDDEADLWLSGPTRITYVLGHEEEAAQLAASVIPTLSLTDGTIQYLDLRFKGKAYVKRFGE
jgi:hypothetical protein